MLHAGLKESVQEKVKLLHATKIR